MDIVESLASLFATVKRYGESAVSSPVYYSGGSGSRLDQAARERAHGLGVEYKIMRGAARPIIPAEPLNCGTAGLAMFRQYVRKTASDGIALAYLSFKRFFDGALTKRELGALWMVEDLPCLPDEKARFQESLRVILPGHRGLVGKLRGLGGWMDGVPPEFLALPEKLGKAARKKEKYPNHAFTGVLALEQCDRNCGHCAVMSGPGLPAMRFDDMRRWVGMVPPHDHIAITMGEPFFWQDREAGANIGHVVEFLTQYGCTITIVTSGINFESTSERAAAEKIASLSPAQKRMVRMNVSVSNLPHIPMEGLPEADAARKAQLGAIRFAWENGMEAGAIDLMSREANWRDTTPELLGPLVASMCPGIDMASVFFSRNNGLNIAMPRRVKEMGRALRDADGVEWLTNPPKMCNADGDYGERGVRVLAGGAHAEMGSLRIGIAGDGSVIPGCCAFPSVFVKIADMNSITSRRELTEIMRGFVERLVRFQYPDLVVPKVRDSDHPSCEECMSLGASIRDPDRARRALGGNRFERIVRLRKA